jgi:hypothetical protein
MIDERGELLAEGPGVLVVQVDLILRAAEGEPHRLIARSPIKIILQGDGYLRCHPASTPAIATCTQKISRSSRTHDGIGAMVTGAPKSKHPPCGSAHIGAQARRASALLGQNGN